MSDKIAIPFYLNQNAINDIYTIIIKKYVNIKSITRKKQCIVKLTTPLSNVMEGKYVEGDLSIQVLNEYSRERIDERVSILIETFISVLDALEDNGMLKHVNNAKDLESVENNDYILINSKINKTSAVHNIEEMINIMEAEKIIRGQDDSQKDKFLKAIKDQMNYIKENKSIKYLSEDFLGTNVKFILPLKTEYIRGNIEHLMNSELFVFAKVINFCSSKAEKERALRIGGSFDCLEDMLNDADYKGFMKNTKKDQLRDIEEYNFIETIPIAIYI
ncbi:hypothetical protein [Haloimpatiens lingqiaonensis]|uniref:hypothetical protein n=1 Tax=Haloimpatiens lingqiaonensis TaxID=1380675 RepID=UPI0010FDD8C7|nr:hypothetical protein [Haloimpatiens lingqiaonensis]